MGRNVLMGKGDTLLKVWLGDKKRFADLYNGSVFQGDKLWMRKS